MPYHGHVTDQQIYDTFFSQSIYSSINNWMKCILLAITMENTMSGTVLLLDSNRKLICLHFVHICQIVMWIWQKYSVNSNQWIQSHNNQSEQQEDGTRRRLNMPITNFISVLLLCNKILCVKCNIQTINIISEQSFTDTALIYVHWVVWKMMWILITQYSWLNKQPV